MHKFDKSTVTFDDPSTWGELASLKYVVVWLAFAGVAVQCAGINVYTKCDHAAQRRASHPASSFVHTLRKGRASLFSYTNTPDGWGHTTKFSSSKRFEPFDKDKVPQPSPNAVVTPPTLTPRYATFPAVVPKPGCL